MVLPVGKPAFVQAQGWQWKFDPSLTNHECFDGAGLLAKVQARVDDIHGEASMLADVN
jgi:hypothetical protein